MLDATQKAAAEGLCGRDTLRTHEGKEAPPSEYRASEQAAVQHAAEEDQDVAHKVFEAPKLDDNDMELEGSSQTQLETRWDLQPALNEQGMHHMA